MSTIQDDDKFLIQRGENSYQTNASDLMSTIQDTDLMLVQRGENSYSVTGEDVKEQLGGGATVADPRPENISYPGTGAGTQASPYVISPNSANRGSGLQSEQTITFTGLPANSLVTFTDENTGTNAARFAQPFTKVNSSGVAYAKLFFSDSPVSNAEDTYTGLITCGETVKTYFSWQITMADLGISTPQITEITTIDGLSTLSPTWPTYITQTSVGALIDATSSNTATGTATNLTPIASPSDAEPPSGTGLVASFEASGGSVKAEIIDQGSGYVWNERIFFDLSSFGGPSQYEFTVKTNPVTGPNTVATCSSFQGFNAGSFVRAEFQVSSDEAFTDPKESSDTSTNLNRSINVSSVGSNNDWYLRFRYVGSATDPTTNTNVVSSWSPPVRSFMGEIVNFAIMISGYGSTPAPSVRTNDIAVAPIPYTYVVGGDMGSHGQPPVQPEKGSQAGQPNSLALMIQVRQPMSWRVTAVSGANNTILELERLVAGVGVPWDALQTSGTSGTYAGVSPDSVTGSGTGFLGKFEYGDDGFVDIVINNPGQNFAVGDVINYHFVPAYDRPRAGTAVPHVDLHEDKTNTTVYNRTIQSAGNDGVTDTLLFFNGGSGGKGDQNKQPGSGVTDYVRKPGNKGQANRNPGSPSNIVPTREAKGGACSNGCGGGGAGSAGGGSGHDGQSGAGGAVWVFDMMENQDYADTLSGLPKGWTIFPKGNSDISVNIFVPEGTYKAFRIY